MAYNPVNPNGQASSANSAPVVIANDQSAVPVTLSGTTSQTKITDGSNIASVYNGGSTPATIAGNAMLSAPTSISYSYSYTASSIGTTYDVGNYKSVSVHINTQYTTSSVTFQGSNDGTNWVAILLSATAANTSATSTSVAGTIYAGSLATRYFRITVTGTYTSGTGAGTITFSSAPFTPAFSSATGVTATPVSAKATGTITTASSSVVSVSAAGFSWALVTIHGTYAGIKFGITSSDDGGTTYYNVPIWDVQNNKYIAPGSTISPVDNSSASFIVPQSSNQSIVKVLASAWTSGTGSIGISGQSNSPALLSTEVNNSAVAGVGMQTASSSISNTLTAIKASGTNTPSTLYGWYFFNNNSTVAYCQIFDVSSTGSVTLGTTAPTMSFGIPAFGGANAFPTQGIKFSNGIVIAMTTTRAGSTAPTSSVDYNIFYQ